LPEPDGPVRPIGGGVSEALTPSHQISSRIEMAIKAASEHTARVDDGLTRLSAGALRFRQGIQIAATTTHFSGAEAHGVTDMGQDLSTQGGPMQLVELVLAQMSELGSGAVVAQAGHLPGI
jgi:hypothetical protein